jgi:hypothetical protein
MNASRSLADEAAEILRGFGAELPVGATRPVLSPLTGEVIAHIDDTSPAQADAAIAQAQAAFLVWRSVPARPCWGRLKIRWSRPIGSSHMPLFPRDWTVSAPRAGHSEKQPGRGLASADPATRTKDAALQIGRISPTLPLCPLGHLQHVQRAAPFDLPTNSAAVQGRGDGAMAGGNGGEMIFASAFRARHVPA